MISRRPDVPQKTDQQRRLSAALRENLKRRKAQAKGRQAPVTQQGQNPHDSVGILDNKRPPEPG